MTKFTPGPWTVDRTTTGFPVVLGPEYEIATPSFAGCNYGTLRGNKIKAAEIAANATLISLTPEMYQALKDVLSRFEREFELLTDGEHGTIYDFPEPAKARAILSIVEAHAQMSGGTPKLDMAIFAIFSAILCGTFIVVAIMAYFAK